jgi:hypothetical protein
MIDAPVNENEDGHPDGPRLVELDGIALRFILQQFQTLQAENAELRLRLGNGNGGPPTRQLDGHENGNPPVMQSGSEIREMTMWETTRGRIVQVLCKVRTCVFWVGFGVGIGFITWKCITYNKSYISQLGIVKKVLILAKMIYDSPPLAPLREIFETDDEVKVVECVKQLGSLGVDFVHRMVAFFFIKIRNHLKTALTQKSISTVAQQAVEVTSTVGQETVAAITTAVPATVAAVSSAVPETVTSITADAIGSVPANMGNTSIVGHLGRSIISDSDMVGIGVGATLAGVKATVGLFSKGSFGPF